MKSKILPTVDCRLWTCLLLLTAYCLLPTCILAQSENTISNDGTTNHFWYVGKDSSARLGVGVDHKQPLSNNLTLGDSLSMGSQTYHPGWAGDGWKIEKDTSEYTLYIDNLNIRGMLSASELLLNQVRATNGNLLVTSAARVDSVTVLPIQIGFNCEDITGHGLAPFLPGDIIMCQVMNNAGATFDGSGDVVNDQYLVKRLIFKVDSVNGLKVYKSNLTGAPANKGKIKKGDTFVRIGNITDQNRSGLIGLYTDEPGSPFIQIKDRVNSWGAWKSDTTTRVYLGNLNEISDDDFGGQLEGYGLYSNNAYIKGKIIVTNPEDFQLDMKWDSLKNMPAFFNAPSGSGLFISSTNMGYYNSITYPSTPWRTYMDNLGRFYLTGSGSNYLSWDGSSLNINGNITLTNTIPLAKVNGAGALAGANNLDDVPNGTSYAKVLKTDIQAGHIKLSSVVGTIDDISNGSLYGKVLLTDIESGHVKLSEAVGNLDDIDNGITYGKVLTTDIQSGHIKLSETIGTLDDVDEGTTYGRILKTDISSGHIKLSEVVGTLDDIDNGSTYGKLLSTEISAGHIKIVGSDNSTTVIDGGKIQSGSIKADDIAVGAITVSKLAAGTANKIVRSAQAPASANVGDIWIDTMDGDKPYSWNGSQWVPAYSSIAGGNIKTGTITATQIAGGTITADKIAGGTITSDKLNVSSLSAISANLGTVTAGSISGISISGSTITGGTIQTSTSGQRVVIDATNQIKFYGSGGSAGSIEGNYLDLDINALVDARIIAGDNVYLQANNGVHISNGSGGGYLLIGGQVAATQDWVYNQGLSLPTQGGNNGKFLTTNGTTASWATIPNSGAVTSIGINTSNGLTVSSSSSNPITNSGTFTIGVQSGYTMPTTVQTTNWDNAFGWGNHAGAGYITSLSSSNSVLSISGTGSSRTLTVNSAGPLSSGYLTSTNWNDFNNKISFPGFGTSGTTACVGNDSRLSDARPASDVYAWAKGSSKPSYTYSEVGAASSSHSHTFSSITGKPSTLSGYGITDTYYGSLGQANLYVASTSGGATTTRLQYYPVTIGGSLHYLLVY